MKVFKKWKLYNIGWFQYMYMWLTPTKKWEDDTGVHYEKTYKGVTYREDFRF